MVNSVFVVNAFDDLKQKSSGGGGFSDGGVINRSIPLKEAGGPAQVVEIAPPPGVVYGGTVLQEINDPGGVSVTNFDPAGGASVSVEEYFVQEDGTETRTNGVVGIPVAAQEIQPVNLFFETGGRLQYPNKLRYKIIPTAPAVVLPAARVLLKYTLLQYDRPADQLLP